MWPDAGPGGIIYLDYNATAPLRPEALDAMLPYLRSVGNASSAHAFGRQASAGVDTARRQISELVGCAPGEVVFTSGATEANNLALRTALALDGGIITTAVEHPAVLSAARALTAEHSRSLTVIDVDAHGLVDIARLEHAVSAGHTAVVSVMAANNETGVLADLEPIIEICRQRDVLVHTDATQMVGKLPIDLSRLDVDLLSLSAHKFGGPQGVGALFIRRSAGVPHQPLLHGGGQERGWRAGTLNVAGIVGAGAAAKAAMEALPQEAARVRDLRDRLDAQLLRDILGAKINGHPGRRLPNVSNILFRGAPADAVLAGMPMVAASDGSACSAGAPGPSHVLTAMGLSRDEAASSVRFSLGHTTTQADVDRAAAFVVEAVTQVRQSLERGPHAVMV